MRSSSERSTTCSLLLPHAFQHTRLKKRKKRVNRNTELASLSNHHIILAFVWLLHFTSPPVQHRTLPTVLNSADTSKLLKLIPSMINKGFIRPCEPVQGQFVSPVFLERKLDGSDRVILNLEKLNDFLQPPHFKLEDYRIASRLIQEGTHLATLDLKDAYHLISILSAHRKFLRFSFLGVLYEYCCLPFGLCSAPYVFTKIIKPILTLLREAGFQSVVYLDDFLLLGTNFIDCKRKCNNNYPPVSPVRFLIFLQKV